MDSTTDHISDVPIGQPIDLTREVVGLRHRDLGAGLVAQEPGRPPRRIDGFTVGAPVLASDAPHDGEMHPDGDELLFVLSGRLEVTMELPDGDRTFEVPTGQTLLVPRGIWHKVHVVEPAQLLHITPGPGGDHRALRTAG